MLVSQSDIARRLRMSTSGVTRLIQRDKSFPEPSTPEGQHRNRRWRLADVLDWERRRGIRNPTRIYDVTEIAERLSRDPAVGDMGDRPELRVLYYLQARSIAASFVSSLRAFYTLSQCEEIWWSIVQWAATPERIESEIAAIETFKKTLQPTRAKVGESAAWLRCHETDGNTGGLLSEAAEPPEFDEESWGAPLADAPCED